MFMNSSAFCTYVPFLTTPSSSSFTICWNYSLSLCPLQWPSLSGPVLSSPRLVPPLPASPRPPRLAVPRWREKSHPWTIKIFPLNTSFRRRWQCRIRLSSPADSYPWKWLIWRGHRPRQQKPRGRKIRDGKDPLVSRGYFLLSLYFPFALFSPYVFGTSVVRKRFIFIAAVFSCVCCGLLSSP